LNRLSRAHEHYRQTTDRQTDGRAIAYSEREREFTFANKTGSLWQIEPVKDTRMPPVDATAVIFRASPVRADFDHAHPSPASQPHALPSHVSVTENLVKFIIVIDS